MLVPRFLTVLSCMGVTLFATAQQLPVSLPSLKDSVKVVKLPDIDPISSPVVRRALVNSLNRQYSRLPQQLLQQQENSLLSKHHHLTGLNDTVKQQFMGYVRNSYGSLKSDQFGKGLKLLKDTSRMNSFIDEKLRGFYALLKDDPAMGSLAYFGYYYCAQRIPERCPRGIFLYL